MTIGTQRNKRRTAYFILTDYVRKGSARSQNRLFIVHRLDRETSGVLVFAKSEEAKLRLQAAWDETEKKYLAIVHGCCQKSAETITTYLAENRAHVVYSTADATLGKLSHTASGAQTDEVLCLAGSELADGQEKPDPRASGRHWASHRRRPQYGRPQESYPVLALHAWTISFRHPTSGQRLTLVAKVPGFFNKLVGAVNFAQV